MGIRDCDVIFTDFSEIARDPLKKAQGYHPEYHARCDPKVRVIEINTALFEKSDFYHWRNWDNIIAHEVGHILLNTPMVNIQTSDDNVGLALTRYRARAPNNPQSYSAI